MITVCDISALARWGDPQLAQDPGEAAPPRVPWTLGSLEELTQEVLRRARIEATPERPLHVLVDRPEHRIRSSRVCCHVWSTPLSAGALVRLTQDVLIATPWFCLQQMAARKSVAAIAKIASELCGCYACSPRAESGYHVRPPLETVASLTSRFSAEHGYGANRVRQALAYAVEGARSPMESALALLFSLPVEEGGCGLPVPEMNLRIEISPGLQVALGKSYLVADVCWPDLRTILEYDSDLFHEGRHEKALTRARNEGLADEGWMVRSVTASLLLDDGLRRNLVQKVAGRAGVELPEGWAYDCLQHDLVRELLFDEGPRPRSH